LGYRGDAALRIGVRMFWETILPSRWPDVIHRSWVEFPMAIFVGLLDAAPAAP
jgi:hypothetical protein